MYRPVAFAEDDLAVLHDLIRARNFAILAGVVGGSVQFAYAPVVHDAHCGPKGAVRFHLARTNPLSQIGGATVRMSFLGPDAYVSPDWYTTANLVPTWNYIAVEGVGVARLLDKSALRQLLIDLSAVQEEKLLPKTPWTLDKMSDGKLEALLFAIEGFEVPLDTLEGKLKLSQDKSASDIAGVIDGLEKFRDPGSRGIAMAMRRVGSARKPPCSV